MLAMVLAMGPLALGSGEVVGVTGSAVGGRLPELRVSGRHLVDESGRPVLLNGTNLGNWLLVETWMLRLGAAPNELADQWEIDELLRARFGRERAAALMEVYRESWMTDRDWDLIPTFGFNVVRLPIDYRLLEDDSAPKQLRPGAWKWIDHAVDEAEKRGLYTILDLHGAPGGQSMEHHTGRSGQNRLWSDPEAQERTIWLWEQMAARYKDRSAVVAYDVLNEPWGGRREQLRDLFERILVAIRRIDPDTLVYAPGFYDNFDFYPSPREAGWTNVGMTMHFYPGLFGDAPEPLSHVRHFRRVESFFEPRLERWGVPFLVGEMNVVLTQAGGNAMMRRSFDLYNRLGYQTTMWSYKVMEEDVNYPGGTWGMVTNGAPYRPINLRTASEAEVEAFFRSFATMPLKVNEGLRSILLADDPVLPPLPELPPVRTSAPDTDRIAGWSVVDIGGAMRGGLVGTDPSSFSLFGAGEDVWGSRDECRFMYRAVRGDGSVSVVVESLVNTDNFAKAGLMLRSSTDERAAALVVTVFPSGDVQVAWRGSAGGSMSGVATVAGGFPRRLEVRVAAGRARVFVDGDEVEGLDLRGDWLRGEWLAGVIALSHEGGQLTEARYRDLRVSGG